MSAEPLSFGQTLRAQREARGWTLAEAAAQAGVSTSYVSELERGTRGASWALAPAVKRVFALYGLEPVVSCQLVELAEPVLNVYEAALQLIAEEGTFDPQAFAQAVLAGTPLLRALADDHASLESPEDRELKARVAARQAIVISACAGDSQGLDRAVAAFLAAGGKADIG